MADQFTRHMLSAERKKTKAEKERDFAYAVAYATAVADMTGEPTYVAVWQRLEGGLEATGPKGQDE